MVLAALCGFCCATRAETPPAAAALPTADEILEKASAVMDGLKSFEADLGADSIGLVELMMQFEDAFDMNIPDEEAQKIKTVGEATQYIEEHL